jgi:ribonuclease H2 subunit B
MEMILKLLKIKIDYFASEDQWNCFDHLVRSLGRDGLLGKDTNQELVRSEYNSSTYSDEVADYLLSAARIKATVEHYSQYLPPSVTKTLNDSYE